jgi:hypothetical protein
MSTATKLEYLNNTKQLLKENINSLGGNLTTEPFRQYASVLEGIYERIPKVSGIGSNLSLSPTMVGKIKLNEIQGDTLQDGTPTPDTPIPIENVTGLQNINVCGKNLFDKDNYNVANVNPGPSTFSYGWRYSTIYIPCQSSTTYTVSRTVLENNFAVASSPEVPATNGTVTNRTIDNTATSITLTTGASDKYLSVYCRYDGDSSYTLAEIIDSIQIEVGSTASEYEEYKGNTYEVNLGKNLLPNTATTQTINGITYTINEDKSITANGTASANSVLNIYGNLTLSAGTYTFSGCPANGSWGTYSMGFGSYNDSGNGATFTKTEDYTGQPYIRIANGTTVNNLVFKPMIEKGSSSTSYSPYFTPIELNKTNDNVYQDSIKKSNGKWYLEKQTGRYNIDTSQITLNNNYTNVEYAIIPKATDYVGYGVWGAQTYLCSHAQWSVNASNWDSVDNIGKIYSGAQIYNWWICFAKGTGLTTIQEKLDGAYVIYPLATPTYTEITNEELINQLESIKSQDGTTNISITSENLPMIINVSALKGDVE